MEESVNLSCATLDNRRSSKGHGIIVLSLVACFLFTTFTGADEHDRHRDHQEPNPPRLQSIDEVFSKRHAFLLDYPKSGEIEIKLVEDREVSRVAELKPDMLNSQEHSAGKRNQTSNLNKNKRNTNTALEYMARSALALFVGKSHQTLYSSNQMCTLRVPASFSPNYGFGGDIGDPNSCTDEDGFPVYCNGNNQSYYCAEGTLVHDEAEIPPFDYFCEIQRPCDD